MNPKNLRALMAQDDHWITVRPNGPGTKGRPVLLDDDTGEIVGGMGGRFNGMKISDLKGAAKQGDLFGYKMDDETKAKAKAAAKERRLQNDPERLASSVKASEEHNRESIHPDYDHTEELEEQRLKAVRERLKMQSEKAAGMTKATPENLSKLGAAPGAGAPEDAGLSKAKKMASSVLEQVKAKAKARGYDNLSIESVERDEEASMFADPDGGIYKVSVKGTFAGRDLYAEFNVDFDSPEKHNVFRADRDIGAAVNWAYEGRQKELEERNRSDFAARMESEGYRRITSADRRKMDAMPVGTEVMSFRAAGIHDNYKKVNSVDWEDLNSDDFRTKYPPVREGDFIKVPGEKPAETGTKAAPVASVDDISADLARRAFSAQSFDPERRGESYRKSYADFVNGLYEKYAGKAEGDEAKAAEFKKKFDELKTGLASKFSAYLEAESRVMSPMITGPARFPVERNQKRMETALKRSEELSDYEKKFEATLEKMFAPAKPAGGESGPDFRALKSDLETIANPGFYDPSLFKASIAGRLETMAQRGDAQGVHAQLDFIKRYQDSIGRPLFTTRHKIWNLGAMADMVAAKRKAEEGTNATSKGKTYKGVNIERNSDDNRLRLRFDGIPDAEVRDELKRSGWRWSPANKAWQRQLTSNAEYSAERILSKFYGSGAGGVTGDSAPMDPAGIRRMMAADSKPAGFGFAITVDEDTGETIRA